jgi:hypothetical protein
VEEWRSGALTSSAHHIAADVLVLSAACVCMCIALWTELKNVFPALAFAHENLMVNRRYFSALAEGKAPADFNEKDAIAAVQAQLAAASAPAVSAAVAAAAAAAASPNASAVANVGTTGAAPHPPAPLLPVLPVPSPAASPRVTPTVTSAGTPHK